MFVRMRGRAVAEEEWPEEDEGEWTMEGEAPVEVELTQLEAEDVEAEEGQVVEASEAQDVVSSLPVNTSPRKTRPRSSLAVGVGLPKDSILAGLSTFAAEQALFDEFLLPAPSQDVDVPFGAPVSVQGPEADRLRAVAEAEEDLRYGYAVLEDGREVDFAAPEEVDQEPEADEGAEEEAAEAAVEEQVAGEDHEGVEAFLDVSLLAQAGNQSLNGLNDRAFAFGHVLSEADSGVAVYERLMNPNGVSAAPTLDTVIEGAPEEALSDPVEAVPAPVAPDESFASTSCSDDSLVPPSPPHPTFSLPTATSPAPPSTASDAVSDAVEGSLEDTLALPSEGDSDAVVLQQLAAANEVEPAEVELPRSLISDPPPPSAVLALPSLSEDLTAPRTDSPIPLVTAFASPARPAKVLAPPRSSTPPPRPAAESHATPQELRRSPIRRAQPPHPAGRSAAPTQRRQLTATTSHRPPLAKAQSLIVSSTSELREGSVVPALAEPKRPSSLGSLAFGTTAPTNGRSQLPSTLIKRPNLTSRATAPVASSSAPTRPLQSSLKARTVPPITARTPAVGPSDTSVASVASSATETAKPPASRLPGPAARPTMRPTFGGLTRPRSPRRNVPAPPSRPGSSASTARPPPPTTTSSFAKPSARPGIEKRTSSYVNGRPTATSSAPAVTAKPAPASTTEARSGMTNRPTTGRPTLPRPPSAPPVTRPEARLAGPTSRLATAVNAAASRRAPFVPAPRPASASSNTSSGSSASVRPRPASAFQPKSRLAETAPTSRPPTELSQPAPASPKRSAATSATPVVSAPAPAPVATSWPSAPASAPAPVPSVSLLPVPT